MANSRVLYYDLLNIAATIAVVYLHCNGIVHTYSDGVEWSTALIVEVLFYWAVPVFFMLTGAKTLGYRARRDTKSFLSGRFVRIFAPFLFWSAVIFFIRFSGFLFPANPEVTFTIRGFVDALMTNEIEPTYWFFFAMFGVTLSIPVLSLLTSNKKTLWYMVGCSFVFTSLLPYLFAFVDFSWNGDISISVAPSYVAYVVLGWLLADEELSLTRRQLRTIYVCGGGCLLFRYAYVYFLSAELGQVDRLLFSYSSFAAVIPSVAVFLWFKHNEGKFSFSDKGRAIIRTVSGASFGVYLIHKLVLDNFVCGVLGFSMQSFVLRIVLPPAIYLVCVLLVLFAKRIPLLRKAVP